VESLILTPGHIVWSAY